MARSCEAADKASLDTGGTFKNLAVSPLPSLTNWGTGSFTAVIVKRLRVRLEISQLTKVQVSSKKRMLLQLSS